MAPTENERLAMEQMRRRGSIGAAMELRAAMVVMCTEERDSVGVAEDISITR